MIQVPNRAIRSNGPSKRIQVLYGKDQAPVTVQVETGATNGAMTGVLIAVGADAIGQARAVVTPESIVLAVTFAMAIGLFFGIEPARRAARLDPIDALRYE